MNKRNTLPIRSRMRSFASSLCILAIASLALFSSVSCSASQGRSGNDSVVDSVAMADRHATLIFVGDAMQHTAQLDAAKSAGKGGAYDYSDCFALIAPIIQEADYAVCNLEVPLGGGPRYSGYPCFSAPDSYAKALKDAGFDMMLTANNHCLDSGDKAARRTLTALDNLGVDHLGTYHDKAQRAKLVPLIKEINGIKFGFLNYTYGTNGIEAKEGTEVAYIDRDAIAREMKAAREQGAEVLVVAMHWGIEYELTENENQRKLAQFLVDNGADLIIGGHPHVIQPMQIVRNEKEGKDVLVVYSLGNFISNMKTTDTVGGALVKVEIGTDEQGRPCLKGAQYDTFFTQKPGGGVRNFRVVPAAQYGILNPAQRDSAKMFERNATRIFDKHNKGVQRIKQ